MARVRARQQISVTQAAEDQVPVHQEMFRSLLQTPHQRVDESLCVHKTQFTRDPSFYGQLATWATHLHHNSVRDLDEVFISVLFDSPYPEHKEAAFVMLQSLPPHQVVRVVRNCTGYDEIVRHVSTSPKPRPTDGFGVTVLPAKYGKRHGHAGDVVPRKVVDLTDKPKLLKRLRDKKKISASANGFHIDTLLVKHAGLGHRTVRNPVRAAIRAYLRYREHPANLSMLEGALLRFYDDMRSLYATSNSLPLHDEESWVNQYLFRNKKGQSGTRLHALHTISSIADPVQQAQLILDYKLPLSLVLPVLSNITPTVWVALIAVMSPQECLQNLAKMQSHGVYNNPDLKNLVTEKLATIKHKKARVDATKGQEVAKSIADLDKDIARAATEVTDSQIKRYATIEGPVALLIDKSASMHGAIEIGKMAGAGIAQAVTTPPICYMFDSMPTPILWKESDGDISTMSAWDKKLRMYRATGGTDPASVIKAMISQRQDVVQIAIVTDEDENVPGNFTKEIKNYERVMGRAPFITIVRLKGDATKDIIQTGLKGAGIDVEVLDCTNIDRFSLPNLLQLMSRNSIFDLVLSIRQLSLPTRQEWVQQIEKELSRKV